MEITDVLVETGIAARRLAVSPERVRQLAEAGTLPVAVLTAGGQRLFRERDIERLRRARERATLAG